jgi:hypothetical protein
VNHGDVKNILVVDVSNLRERGKSLGKVKISVLRCFISKLSPVGVGWWDRGPTGWGRVEMALEEYTRHFSREIRVQGNRGWSHISRAIVIGSRPTERNAIAVRKDKFAWNT